MFPVLTLPLPVVASPELNPGATLLAMREAARQLVATHLPHFTPRIIVPITHGRIVVGILFAGSQRSDRASSEEQLLFGVLAEQLAVAIVNARLVMVERRESYVAETLLQVTRLFNGLRDVDKICQTAVSALRQISGVQHSLVGFWESTADELTLKDLFADSEETRQLLLQLSAPHQAELLAALERMGDLLILKPTRQKTSGLNELLARADTTKASSSRNCSYN